MTDFSVNLLTHDIVQIEECTQQNMLIFFKYIYLFCVLLIPNNVVYESINDYSTTMRLIVNYPATDILIISDTCENITSIIIYIIYSNKKLRFHIFFNFHKSNQ